ncbi:MAG: ferrous iron transporter B [Candidatus Omnitrophota bacterium]|nr:MAG: ferrous iron transporter B [Candidatus Omnitrophota bacterium]
MRVLLVSNPNVGKSVLFSHLTGARVLASNYPGTTVEITKGFLKLGDIRAEVIDAPGTYGLTPTNKAEEVALELLNQADVIVNVVDATNLERNLSLTVDLLQRVKKPFIVVLNMWDETKHKGIDIDIEKLKKLLGVKVIPTCGLTGQGVKELVEKIKTASPPKDLEKEKWSFIGKIIERVQKLSHRHHTIWDILEEVSVKPPWAYPIAVAIVILSFQVIRFVGEGLINYVFAPLFTNFYTPLIMKLSFFIRKSSFLHSILIGKLGGGEIDYSSAFGLLTTGLYVPIAMVLPYVFSFYLVLGVLEDWGYLPRLAILADRAFHKVGLHGYAIVPMVLGLGCNVPGALSTRLFEERREKFIAATLVSIAVPCMAQSAMVIGVLGRLGGQFVGIVFLILFLVWFILGIILNRFLKGESPEILVEIPPYRLPSLKALYKKLWIRLSWFFSEALPYVLLGVLFVNILYYLKIIDFLAVIFSPIMTRIWGLPDQAIGALIVGFLRKDVAVGMLRPLNLSVRQLIVGVTILTIYFPCVATFVVLLRELKIKDMLKSIAIMLSTALVVGGVVNFILSLLKI